MQLFKKRLHQNEGGFTYIWVLLSVAFMGLGSVTLVEVDSLIAQREKEKELISIGHQFREALKNYYEAPLRTGGLSQYPARLEDLLEDGRSGIMRRHLRKIFVDPLTGSDEWGTKIIDGRIVGIYSLSVAMPMKQDGFEVDDLSFRNAVTHGQWIFSYPPNFMP